MLAFALGLAPVVVGGLVLLFIYQWIFASE